jgi:hypothetical protein
MLLGGSGAVQLILLLCAMVSHALCEEQQLQLQQDQQLSSTSSSSSCSKSGSSGSSGSGSGSIDVSSCVLLGDLGDCDKDILRLMHLCVGTQAQWQQLPQLLEAVGTELCSNPDCVNLSGVSEALLVGGKGCVCGGCKIAR